MSYEFWPVPTDLGIEILRTEVGSTLHGTGIPGGEDHDEMGIFVEHPRTTIGLSNCEHYQRRSKPEGVKSEHGDTDLVCYTLRKWAGLALKGNPSVLLPLFAPEDKVVLWTQPGAILRGHPQWFWSKQAGKQFLGYMRNQRHRMTGERGRAGRVRLMEDGQVDWKYAMHMLRLGYQGIDFMKHGSIQLPMDPTRTEYLKAVRQGKVHLEDVLFLSETLEAMLQRAMDDSSAPDRPDYEMVSLWVQGVHLSVWRQPLEQSIQIPSQDGSTVTP